MCSHNTRVLLFEAAGPSPGSLRARVGRPTGLGLFSKTNTMRVGFFRPPCASGCPFDLPGVKRLRFGPSTRSRYGQSKAMSGGWPSTAAYVSAVTVGRGSVMMAEIRDGLDQREAA